MCNCGNRAFKFLRRIGFGRTTESFSLAYETHRARLTIDVTALKRHHFRLTLLGLMARILS